MRIRFAHGLALALSVVSLGAAQGPTSAGSAHARISQARPAASKATARKKPYQVGTASWYGQDFVGKPTASGEPYNMYDMTAAHPSLPLGTYVKVTNLRNGRAVVVRINDRGPVVDGRIIDVSYNAAKALNFKNQGIQRVRLDLVPPAQTVAMLQPLAN
jgi:rare lipoprotein A